MKSVIRKIGTFVLDAAWAIVSLVWDVAWAIVCLVVLLCVFSEDILHFTKKLSGFPSLELSGSPGLYHRISYDLGYHVAGSQEEEPPATQLDSFILCGLMYETFSSQTGATGKSPQLQWDPFMSGWMDCLADKPNRFEGTIEGAGDELEEFLIQRYGEPINR